ncbi:MAG: N-acetylmuramoyl-L-alanine amidase [Muribaculaceae bacterium]|nr:N-acetylmuramoyl-L-alanine amidase [Muribaculaceae bacterium]
MRKINLIIVHCTATPAGRRVTADEVDRWHRQRGFNGIGYHYLVGIDGSVEKGRPVEVSGAHCKGHNMASIGVAYAGGLDSQGRPADTRTPEQRRALRELIAALRKRFPQAQVRGHRDFAAKACPCFNATSEYASL